MLLRIFCFLLLLITSSLFAEDASITSIDITRIQETDSVIFGNQNAPITMIIYDSITCHHCAAFNTETFDKIRKNYIDNGKVHVIMRDFPLDAIALRLSAMLKCFEYDVELYQRLRVALFNTQRQWIFQKNDEKRLETAKNILKFANLDRQKMDSCMVDENNINIVMDSRTNAIKGGLTATPMFIINGTIYEGLRSYEFFAKKIDEILMNIHNNDKIKTSGSEIVVENND